MRSVKERMLKKKLNKLYRKSTNMSKKEINAVMQAHNRLQRAKEGVDTWDEAARIIQESESLLKSSIEMVDDIQRLSDSQPNTLSSDFYAAITAIKNDSDVYLKQLTDIRNSLKQKAGYVLPDQAPQYFTLRNALDTISIDIATNIQQQLETLQSMVINKAHLDTEALNQIEKLPAKEQESNDSE